MGGIRRGFVAPTGMDYAVAVPRAARRDLAFVELFAEGSTDRKRIAEEASELGTLATVHGVGLVVHLPTGVDLASPHEQVQDGALVEMKAALDAAAQVDATRAVLRPTPHYGRASPDVEARRNRLLASVRALDDYAADRGIGLCLRVPQASIDLRDGLARLFEETEADACLDTGLARLAGHDETDQATLLLERDERIPHLHLRDVRVGGSTGADSRESGGVDWSVSAAAGLTGEDDGSGASTGDDAGTGERRVSDGRPSRSGAGERPPRSGDPVRGLPFGAGDVDFDRLLDPIRLGWSGTVSLAVGTDDEGYLDESVRRLDDVL